MPSAVMHVISPSITTTSSTSMLSSVNTVVLSSNTHGHNSPVRSQSHYHHYPHALHQRSATSTCQLIGNIHNMSADLTAYQQIIARRKSFRTRGSLVNSTIYFF